MDRLFDHFMSRLSYCEETGKFRWTDAKYGRCQVGDVAGSLDALGYVVLSVKSKRIKAHRLAWRVMTGKWPDGCVDHLNGNPEDNRFANLRDVTPAENRQNQHRVRSDSRTGVQGVRYIGNFFVAFVRTSGRARRIGSFESADLAHAAYLEEKRRSHKAFAG